MATSTVTSMIPETELKTIEKDAKKVVSLIEKVRVHLGQIFISEGNEKKLHSRYIQQRKDKTMVALEAIWEVVKKYPYQAYRFTLVVTVLRTIMVTQWKGKNIIETQNIFERAKQILSSEKTWNDTSWALLILNLISESGISTEWLERFFTVTSRRISTSKQ